MSFTSFHLLWSFTPTGKFAAHPCPDQFCCPNVTFKDMFSLSEYSFVFHIVMLVAFRLVVPNFYYLMFLLACFLGWVQQFKNSLGITPLCLVTLGTPFNPFSLALRAIGTKYSMLECINLWFLTTLRGCWWRSSQQFGRFLFQLYVRIRGRQDDSVLLSWHQTGMCSLRMRCAPR